jgi:hypothetical protein
MKSNSEASERRVPQLVRRFCDGGCETHQGEVKRVRVHHGSKDWGWWNYCDEARAEDKRRGMTVEFENVSCSQCGRDFGSGEHGFSHCADHSPTND